MWEILSSTIIPYAAIATALGSLITLAVNIVYGEAAKTRRKIMEDALKRCDEQISKLYAPLENLIEQLDITDELKKEMITQDRAHATEISKICYDAYFVPIHDKIAILLQNSLHLLEDEHIPPSFIAYYKHVASEKVFFSLVSNMEKAKAANILPIDSPPITCTPFPYPELQPPGPNFKFTVKQGFDSVLKQQEDILRRMKKALPSDPEKNSN